MITFDTEIGFREATPVLVERIMQIGICPICGRHYNINDRQECAVCEGQKLTTFEGETNEQLR